MDMGTRADLSDLHSAQSRVATRLASLPRSLFQRLTGRALTF